ncbi:transaldolase [Pragia fontium]|uniref:Transaldolase n=1 Tax=Pragia fontium DSM 5563 = ATCC 49100 TaxID=1122977 RepID=A0AAJ4W9T5_9GAMM|nr:transaldolase [Pragia fontium]SFC62658.1 transaldolase [Pragia fontium DSM 5563 = ATCC 49100]
MNQLEALKQVTTVVADSGDLDSIRQFSPEDATTNPSLILKAAELPQYQHLIDAAINDAKTQGGDKATQLINASDRIAVYIGAEIVNSIPGRISTEVDARLSFDRGMCVAKARKLISLYQKAGIDKSRILIKLAATWEGIRAAEELENEGIHCNLTLLFSFAQARACAEAGVYLISPFVGRIYDWYQANQPITDYQAETDPGVVSVRHIYQYYKQHRYPTVIMGASFRRTEQILALAGCDRLTISPALLKQLQESNGSVARKLAPTNEVLNPPSKMTEAEFRWQYNQDPMAVDKLAEGIRLFAADQQKLETMLAARLSSDKIKI